jgi:hypothetical protein
MTSRFAFPGGFTGSSHVGNDLETLVVLTLFDY